MGKQMSKASVKISNHRSRHHTHRQLNCLKPKVYITHSSSFKTLVQELTGNSGESEPSFVSAISPPSHEAETHGLQIKHEDQHTRNNNDYVCQDNIELTDDQLFTAFGHTSATKTSNQVDLLEVDSFSFSSLFDSPNISHHYS